MSKLSAAFTTAWVDLKKGAAKVTEFLTKNKDTIQAVVKEASAVATVIDPAAGPVVTEFDAFEEQVIGKVLELATDTANATTLSGLFGTAWPAILALKDQLSVHPAVSAAKG